MIYQTEEHKSNISKQSECQSNIPSTFHEPSQSERAEFFNGSHVYLWEWTIKNVPNHHVPIYLLLLKSLIVLMTLSA